MVVAPVNHYTPCKKYRPMISITGLQNKGRNYEKCRMYNIPVRTPGFEPAAHFTVAHAPSHLERRSVVMTLEDYSHGGHRAVLPTTFTKERMKTLRDPAKLLSCFADRNRGTRTPDPLDISQMLYPLSYVPLPPEQVWWFTVF